MKLQRITLQQFLSEYNELITRGIISKLNHQNELFCFKHEDEKPFYIIWIIHKKFSSGNNLPHILELLSSTFIKSEKRIQLSYEHYHKNAIALEVNRNEEHFEMNYYSGKLPINCTYGFIKYIDTHFEDKRKVLNVCTQFAQILSHECEHGLQDLKSTVDRLDHLMISEGMAEFTSYFTHNTLFTPHQKNYLDTIERHAHTKKPIEKPAYVVGFYLYLLLFLKTVRHNDPSILKEFESFPLSKKIGILKDLKKLFIKHKGKEVLRTAIIEFREYMYAQHLEEIIAQFKHIEEELHLNTTYAQDYL